MIEKRFESDGWSIWDYETYTEIGMMEASKLLNQMHNQIQELYDFRLLYNAHLFNQWYEHNYCEVFKSKRHNDGEVCFDGEWFIVVAILPNGKQITNHYNITDWDLFKIPEKEKVTVAFDEHTPQDVLDRLREVI